MTWNDDFLLCRRYSCYTVVVEIVFTFRFAAIRASFNVSSAVSQDGQWSGAQNSALSGEPMVGPRTSSLCNSESFVGARLAAILVWLQSSIFENQHFVKPEDWIGERTDVRMLPTYSHITFGQTLAAAGQQSRRAEEGKCFFTGSSSFQLRSSCIIAQRSSMPHCAVHSGL